MNTVQITGRFTKDPEVRYLDNGNALCKVTVATDRPVKNAEKKAAFIPVTLFGKNAENAGRYLAKGSKVAVTGYISTGSYDKDGQRYYTWEVVANTIEFLDNKSDSQQEPQGRAEQIAGEAIDRLNQEKQYEQIGFSAVDDSDIPF